MTPPNSHTSCCAQTSEDIVAAIEAKRLDIFAVDDNSSTALHYAAAAGRTDLVQLLLDRRASTGASDGMGLTPIMQAERNGRAEVRRHAA